MNTTWDANISENRVITYTCLHACYNKLRSPTLQQWTVSLLSHALSLTSSYVSLSSEKKIASNIERNYSTLSCHWFKHIYVQLKLSLATSRHTSIYLHSIIFDSKTWLRLLLGEAGMRYRFTSVKAPWDIKWYRLRVILSHPPVPCIIPVGY